MQPMTFPRFKSFKDDNSPGVGWKAQFFIAGTVTPQDTYTDSTLVIPNANPVIMDGSGEADIWLNPALQYKLQLSDENDVVQRVVDNIGVLGNGNFNALAASTLAVLGAIGVGGAIASTVETGTAPLSVASTTKVANLNVDLLDGADWAAPLSIGTTTPQPGTFTTINVLSDASFHGNLSMSGNLPQVGAHAEQRIRAYVSEEITLSTSGATSDSAAFLLPANSVIDAVVAFVTATITTATDWKLGDATQAARFCAAQSGAQLVSGASVVGLAHRDPTVATANLGPVQAGASQLRITTTGTPGSGKIRVTVWYTQFISPTS